MALLSMIEFFEMNGISPNEVMGPKMKTLECLIKKRINGVFAILKDIEIVELKNEIRKIERGELEGNIKTREQQVLKLEKEELTKSDKTNYIKGWKTRKTDYTEFNTFNKTAKQFLSIQGD